MDQRAIERKQEALAQIDAVVEQLSASPLDAYRRAQGYLPVMGEGDPNAAIVLVGEAPGRREAETGRPFVGNAGRVLDELLAAIGLTRAEIFITSVIKDRPPDNRDPRADEIALYGPFLLQQLQIIQPKIIATLGRFALNFMLVAYALPQQGKKISELHGQLLSAQTPYGAVTIVPLYHPAATFYNQDRQAILMADFQALKRFIDGERP